MRAIALVVTEPGSDWPLHDNREELDVVAFGQPRDEPDEALLRRICEQSGRPGYTLAVLACNSDTDEEAMSRRAGLLRALLTRVTLAASGRVVLAASGGASAELRNQLLGLAGALFEGSGTGAVSVSVSFGDRIAMQRPDPLHRPLASFYAVDTPVITRRALPRAGMDSA
jgi:hypothetical protein